MPNSSDSESSIALGKTTKSADELPKLQKNVIYGDILHTWSCLMNQRRITTLANTGTVIST
jgi:hypothetical protein